MGDKLTAGVTDLDTSLTDVNRDDFTHFDRLAIEEAAERRHQRVVGRARRGEEHTHRIWRMVVDEKGRRRHEESRGPRVKERKHTLSLCQRSHDQHVWPVWQQPGFIFSPENHPS